MPLLEVIDLSISFTRYAGALKQETVRVMDGLQLSADEGEIVAVIGSSGSGKSLLAHAILGILPDHAMMTGTIRFKGEPLDAARQAAIRGKEIALIPQSVNSLDPLMKVGNQIRVSAGGKIPEAQVQNLFHRFRLPGHAGRLFPFQLSGGMARKVLAATAAAGGAQLIVADEPTPGLHPDDVREVLQRMKELALDGAAVLLITHDIEAALSIADKIAVFYAGTTVEIAEAGDFSGDGHLLRHPYSKALWRALPQNEFVPLPGFQPGQGEMPPGCPFAPRCPEATVECSAAMPEMRALRGGMVRCVHAS